MIITTQALQVKVFQLTKEVVDLVNIERAKAGLNPLTLDSSISNVATKISRYD